MRKPAPRPTRGRTRPGRRTGRLGWAVRIAVAGLLLAAAAIAGAFTVTSYLTEQGYPRDMKGDPVLLPPPPVAVQEQTHAIPSVDGRTLRVPSTGLNVPLGELNEVGGIIDPPGFASAYLVRNYGSDLTNAATGTVFVVMHSCRRGAICPGNYLIDVAAGTASVRTGADIYVARLHYRATGWQKVPKPDVRSASDVWAIVPGRLVLLTCLQIPAQTASIDNMIITATLVPRKATSGYRGFQ